MKIGKTKRIEWAYNIIYHGNRYNHIFSRYLKGLDKWMSLHGQRAFGYTPVFFKAGGSENGCSFG